MIYAKRIYMRTVQVKRTRQKEIESAIAAKVCIVPGCDEPMHGRGCCKKHLNQFNSGIRRRKSDDEKADFEQQMIREGMVLDSYEQRTLRTSNPFEDLAKKVAS
ncbi:MAG: hypothetical protein WBD31_01460 [Rubripirellula sp.]